MCILHERKFKEGDHLRVTQLGKWQDRDWNSLHVSLKLQALLLCGEEGEVLDNFVLDQLPHSWAP